VIVEFNYNLGMCNSH